MDTCINQRFIIMKYHFLVLFSFVLFSISCSDKDADNLAQNLNMFECEQLIDALLQEDDAVLESILNTELKNFDFIDLNNDACIHDNNLKEFTQFLNESCSQIEASVICCGCIETLPTISEISIEIDSSTDIIKKIIDLKTPNETGIPLSFAGIH